MLTLESEVAVEGLTGREVTDFMLDCRDDTYQAWWPGTHLEFHLLKHGTGGDHVGDLVLMDEYVGSRRVRMLGEVIDAVPAERIAWQLRRGRLRLPVRVTLALSTAGQEVRVRHTVTVGWTAHGRWLDPLWRLYFSRCFAGAMDRHVRTEFLLMRHLLHPMGTALTDDSAAVGIPTAANPPS
ncbi:hypothetical protein [Mycobacterium szulgai]|uniref:Polyketide cyclase n=1 Tax=Mycobacterium szulgai TaxID=1787 RepID=A0A1X2DW24_MYCSZ|nr:hypothetical protein [Mycobacterium szulgai]MCV7079001.1 hypothetical protein [Mycobacterium szulgai]ORW92383.1 hypothetical protein AWC27_09015 [Mycobacterium szulgai]